jgi:hypothetical protein
LSIDAGATGPYVLTADTDQTVLGVKSFSGVQFVGVDGSTSMKFIASTLPPANANYTQTTYYTTFYPGPVTNQELTTPGIVTFETQGGYVEAIVSAYFPAGQTFSCYKAGCVVQRGTGTLDQLAPVPIVEQQSEPIFSLTWAAVPSSSPSSVVLRTTQTTILSADRIYYTVTLTYYSMECPTS